MSETETQKKEPKNEEEKAYVTRAEINDLVERFNDWSKDFQTWVENYVKSRVSSLVIRPIGEYATHEEGCPEHAITREEDYAFNELKELLGDESLELQGRKPSALKSAMSYILAKHRDESVSLEHIAHTYGINCATLRKNVKLLQDLIKKKGLKVSIHYFAPEEPT